MKKFTLVFGVYILFLMVLPSFAMTVSRAKPVCPQKTCCHKCKSSQNSKGNQKDNSKGNCTPFFGCSNIQVVVQQTEKAPSVAAIGIQNFIIYLPSVTSDFCSESWHPPRINF